jgi:hypothetical protein
MTIYVAIYIALLTGSAVFVAMKAFAGLMSGTIYFGQSRGGIAVERSKNPITYAVVIAIHGIAIFALAYALFLRLRPLLAGA